MVFADGERGSAWQTMRSLCTCISVFADGERQQRQMRVREREAGREEVCGTQLQFLRLQRERKEEEERLTYKTHAIVAMHCWVGVST